MLMIRIGNTDIRITISVMRFFTDSFLTRDFAFHSSIAVLRLSLGAHSFCLFYYNLLPIKLQSTHQSHKRTVFPHKSDCFHPFYSSAERKEHPLC